MKHFSFSLLFFACLFTALTAQTNNQVKIAFDHRAGNQPMSIGHSNFPIWNNKMVQLSRAELYVSEISLRQSDGTETLLTDQYLLIDVGGPQVDFDLGSWPIASVTGVTLHLGVPASVNHLDPTTYPAGHPLAPQNPSMHWGWAAGYRFMAMEGKIDNDNDGAPETLFEFHNVGDEMYKTIELTGVQTAENGVLRLQFSLDYAELFNNMEMATPPLSFHGNTGMNIAMMNNAAAGNFVDMESTTSSHEVELLSRNISAAPNPFSAETLIRYELPASPELSMVITSAAGQVMRSFRNLPAAGTVRVEGGKLPAGVYSCIFYEGNQLLARKQLIVSE